MYRVDPQHLLFVLENLAQGTVVNRVQVHPDAADSARAALERMLAHVASKPVAVKS
jgi:quinolinate synthase